VIRWFLSLDKAAQAALASSVASAIVIGVIAVLGFWITYRTSISANRDVIAATKTIQLEAIAISAASKQAEFRQAWINSLRIAITRYLSMVPNLVDKQTNQISQEKYERVVYQIEYIELMLNMTEQPSQALTADLRELFDRATASKNPDEVYAARKKAAESTRKILKAEWDKLRTELKTRK